MTSDDVKKFKENIHKIVKSNNHNRTLRLAATGKAPKIKKGYTGAMQWDSYSEYVFYKYMTLIHHSYVERNTDKFLYYIDLDGKQRKFYYDFVVDGVPSEVKGIFKTSDHQKQMQHPEVLWYNQDAINQMRKELNASGLQWQDDWHNKI